MEEDIALLPLVNEQEKKNVGAWGENGEEKQELLYASRVMVVGSDVLSQMVLANLTGLGIGNICCVDEGAISAKDRYNFLCLNNNKNILGEKRVKDIATMLEAINPLLSIAYYESPFEKGHAEEFRPEIIIDATNNIKSKNNCLDYCIQECLPLVSVTSSQESSVLSIWNLNGDGRAEGLENIANHELLEQGSYTSGVIAGLAADQVRKLKFQTSDNGLDKPLGRGQSISYNPNSHPYNGKPFENLKVLVVGAGAVGNFVALNLALLGVGNIDIVDGDNIEPHNLNRQLLLYGRVGDLKAEVLSDRVKEINSSIRGEFHNYYLTEETTIIDQKKNERGYDSIFGCVDNYKARYLINRLAAKHNIPYIDGGTSATSGRVAVYVPGKNRCMDCQFDLKGYIKKEEPKSEGCTDNPNPAIVIPNIIIGSAMVAEFANIFSGTPQLLKKVFKYDTYSKEKIYSQPALAIGRCEAGCL